MRPSTYTYLKLNNSETRNITAVLSESTYGRNSLSPATIKNSYSRFWVQRSNSFQKTAKGISAIKREEPGFGEEIPGGKKSMSDSAAFVVVGFSTFLGITSSASPG